jgi:Fe2+ or Zn2+ uptake regulation protein
LASILASPYNSLRALAAEQLVEALNLTNEDVFNRPNVQQAISLLGSVNWGDQIDTELFRESAIQINDLLK